MFSTWLLFFKITAMYYTRILFLALNASDNKYHFVKKNHMDFHQVQGGFDNLEQVCHFHNGHNFRTSPPYSLCIYMFKHLYFCLYPK